MGGFEVPALLQTLPWALPALGPACLVWGRGVSRPLGVVKAAVFEAKAWGPSVSFLPKHAASSQGGPRGGDGCRAVCLWPLYLCSLPPEPW